MSAVPIMRSAQCSVLSGELKQLDPKSALSMDLGAAYQRCRKWNGILAHAIKPREILYAQQQSAAALVEYNALKQRATREGFKV